MDIYVQATATKDYKPDVVNFSFNYEVLNKTYESALKNGTAAVEEFVKLLDGFKINKEDLKTTSFRLYKKNEYDYKLKKDNFVGFVYSQVCNLTVNYDVKLMAGLMEKVSQLKTPPKYTIRFGLRDEESAKNEVLALVFNEAKNKAEVIAKSAGKKLKNCLKVSFSPFEERVTSNTAFDSREMMMCEKRATVAEAIESTFVPEDITIEQTLYYLWQAD